MRRLWRPDVDRQRARERSVLLHIYLFFRNTNAIVLASRGLGGAAANGPSLDPALSGDGATLVFASAATNLVPADTNGISDVFQWRAAEPDTLARVSIALPGRRGSDAARSPSSDDGQVIAFVSTMTSFGDASDTLQCETQNCGRAYVRKAGTTVRLPAWAAGERQDGGATSVEVSGDCSRTRTTWPRT